MAVAPGPAVLLAPVSCCCSWGVRPWIRGRLARILQRSSLFASNSSRGSMLDMKIVHLVGSLSSGPGKLKSTNSGLVWGQLRLIGVAGLVSRLCLRVTRPLMSKRGPPLPSCGRPCLGFINGSTLKGLNCPSLDITSGDGANTCTAKQPT